MLLSLDCLSPLSTGSRINREGPHAHNSLSLIRKNSNLPLAKHPGIASLP
jgi:hypothetical protein